MDYKKPFKSIQEQILILKERGLIINNDAQHYLQHINYYRLSGYWRPFEYNNQDCKNIGDHNFKKGTHFDDVLNLYVFDRNLKLLLLDTIERIEVSIRTQWAYYCAQQYGSHAYINKDIHRNSSKHQKNLSILNDEISRSNESFIKHYHKKYAIPEKPPIWVICEVMSLGLLSKWLKNLKPSDVCTKIASKYQLSYSCLVSFIEHLAYLRNLCAHHSRVWNRKFTKTMTIPKSKLFSCGF